MARIRRPKINLASIPRKFISVKGVRLRPAMLLRGLCNHINNNYIILNYADSFASRFQLRTSRPEFIMKYSPK